MSRILISVIFFLSSILLYSQKDIEISGYLKMIEEGSSNDVLELLPDLKKKYPLAPSLFYLEGVLNEDGETAVKLFKTVSEKYPKSIYADASLYRLYSYYTAVNEPGAAGKYSGILQSDYPSSPYLKLLPSYNGKKTEIPSGFLYTIQAGAFSNNANAENLRSKFEKAGYYTFIKDKIVGGTIFKVVFAGRFKTMTEAENFQIVLNRKYGLKGIVTKLQ